MAHSAVLYLAQAIQRLILDTGIVGNDARLGPGESRRPLRKMTTCSNLHCHHSTKAEKPHLVSFERRLCIATEMDRGFGAKHAVADQRSPLLHAYILAHFIWSLFSYPIESDEMLVYQPRDNVHLENILPRARSPEGDVEGTSTIQDAFAASVL